MIKPLMIAPPLLFAALATMFMWGMNRGDPNVLPSTLEGRQAPVLELRQIGDLDLFTADALRQPGVKLVNYWASWCAPCRVEHPTLEALAAEAVPTYGINYKDDPRKALKFLADPGNPYVAVGADEKGRSALEWGVYGVPETYVIDGDGVIILRVAGPVTQRVLKNAIRPAMARAAQTK